MILLKKAKLTELENKILHLSRLVTKSALTAVENKIADVSGLVKVNKSIYIAKSRQQYYKTLNNILLHVPNHALKDLYMLNYGITKNTNSSYYTRSFVINFFIV